MPLYATEADYLAAISRHRAARQQREQAIRVQSRIWKVQGRTLWGWTEFFAIHPDNENAPWLPEMWRFVRTSKFWYCCVRDGEADEVEGQARILLGIQDEPPSLPTTDRNDRG